MKEDGQLEDCEREFLINKYMALGFNYYQANERLEAVLESIRVPILELVL